MPKWCVCFSSGPVVIIDGLKMTDGNWREVSLEDCYKDHPCFECLDMLRAKMGAALSPAEEAAKVAQRRETDQASLQRAVAAIPLADDNVSRAANLARLQSLLDGSRGGPVRNHVSGRVMGRPFHQENYDLLKELATICVFDQERIKSGRRDSYV